VLLKGRTDLLTHYEGAGRKVSGGLTGDCQMF
jgi:hypothetical protein